MSYSRWIVSCDLGQRIDPTAVAVLEVRPPAAIAEAVTPHDMEVALAARHPPRIDVRHLERLPLGTEYHGVVAHVGSLLRRSPLDRGGPALVLDQTGVGTPVVEMFTRAGLRPIGVTITGGDKEVRVMGTGRHEEWHVAKLLLVSRVQAGLNDGSLRIAKDLPDARTLAVEMQDFRASISDAGYTRFGAREGAHDDLILAVAIGAWQAGRRQPEVSFFDVMP